MRLTAVEIEPQLVELLRERFRSSLGVDIVEGDATGLEFPDERFSGAASFTMLHHVPTPELQDRLFAEVARVLRPGGVFAVGDSPATPEREVAHVGDTYIPVDPATVAPRLRNAGFARAEVGIGRRSRLPGQRSARANPDRVEYGFADSAIAGSAALAPRGELGCTGERA